MVNRRGMALVLIVAAGLTAAVGCGSGGSADSAKSSPPASPPTTETYEDVRGGTYRLPGAGACKGVVLIFWGHDCPISNGYAPEVARLYRDFSSKGIAFCVVYADTDLTKDDGRKHVEEYGIPCPAILDPKLTLASKVGATVKPEAAVLSPTGEVLYLGRIDDSYVDFGKKRAAPMRRDLRDAVVAVLAGQPIAVPRTKALGCDIDFPQEKK